MTTQPLYSGRLNQRVVIQEPTYVQDASSGELVATWGTLREVWASVEPFSVREFIQSGARQAELSAKIVTRYWGDVTAVMRVLHRGKVYQIEGVQPDADSGLEYMTLICSEGVTEA